jgi:hypothetical protein
MRRDARLIIRMVPVAILVCVVLWLMEWGGLVQWQR